tara:strand:+ start:148 stop:1467 length:1320 start_codon:yes stop_codon:yes gene_type:complete
MSDFQIGTQYKDGSVYAGPQYGFVKPKQYQKLLAEGKLGRGQQTFNKGLKVLGNRFNNAYQTIPQNLRTKINGNGKGIWNGAQQIAKGAWDVQPQDHKNFATNALRVADAPAWAVTELSKKVDPTGRGISKDVVNTGEMLLPFLGGAKNIATKNAKKLLTKIDDVGQAAFKSKNKLALAGDAIPTNGKSVPNGNGGNGGNGHHKPSQITVDPKYREIGPGFTQRTDIQNHLKNQNVRIKKTKDTELINRIISTPPDKIDPSVLVYGRDKFKNALYDLHHMDAKGETGAIVKLMREIGDEEDVVNLYAYMALRGVGGGDKMSNLLYMNKPAHWKIHKWRRNNKLEMPSNVLYKTLKEQAGGDTNKLMAIVDEMIGDNFIVSRSKALQFQKEFVDEFKHNKLKLVSPKQNVKVIKRRTDKLSVEELYESIPDHYFEKGMTI